MRARAQAGGLKQRLEALTAKAAAATRALDAADEKAGAMAARVEGLEQELELTKAEVVRERRSAQMEREVRRALLCRLVSRCA